MRKFVAIVLLLLSGACALAQRSYILADGDKKDADYQKGKSQQAGLDLGLTVLANRIPIESMMAGSKPSKHLLKEGPMHLQLPMDDNQTDFAVYHSEVFDRKSSVNILQIDNELIVYRTMETTGNIHLLYQCTRGAYGTKKSAHAKNAPVYRLWDTPERCLLPDLELQDQMAKSEAKKCGKTEYSLLIFNDLKSYGCGEKGDEAIAHFLDTMQKYNPGKRLQADLLTPASQTYLSQVNENQLWNESMRTKIVETLSEQQDYYRTKGMPWMIGNFQIHLADKYRKATTLEELEWFLSKAAAFDAGFGLDFSAATMRQHGLTDTLLGTIKLWEKLRMNGAFSEEQKEAFKDPYGNWHIEQADSSYLIYPQYVSRRYPCHFEDDSWIWDSPYAGPFALRIAVEGKGSISGLSLRTPNGTIIFPCTLKAGQYLIYDFDGSAWITDLNFNKLEEVIAHGTAILNEGETEVTFSCEVQKEKGVMPRVTLRYITRGKETGLLRASQ